MQLRKLAIAYKDVASKQWMDRLLPNFCFGILSKRLGSLVDASCETIKTICETKVGEDLVSELAVRFFSQLRTDDTPVDLDENGDDIYEHRSYSEFECFNVSLTEKKIAKVFLSRDPESALLRDFHSVHAASDLVPVSSRSKALKVLNAVPHVAEKRSRQIVPHFLSWATKEDDVSDPTDDDLDGTNSQSLRSSWNQFDRRAMLSVFS
ncbi:U3 snoRNP protein, partial [Ascosphaera atra]